MMSPSAQMLPNFVNIYQPLSGPDGEGGPQFLAGSIVAQNVPCSVQYRGTEEWVDVSESGQQRISVRNVYQIMFASYQNYPPRTQIVQTDVTPNRTLIVQSSPPSEAGRNAAWFMRAIEVL